VPARDAAERISCPTSRAPAHGRAAIVAGRILGHASITTTANVDGHLTDRILDRTGGRTDVILGRITA